MTHPVAPSPTLTAPQRRALVALVEASEPRAGAVRRHPTNPRHIAAVLWPDSPGWNKTPHRRDGRAGGRGATMPMNAARILWRLRDYGLVYRPNWEHNGWLPTTEGLAHYAYYKEVGLA